MSAAEETAGHARLAAVILLIVAMALAAGNPVVGRGIIDDIPPAALTFWRFVAAVTALLPFAAGTVRRQARTYRANARLFCVLAAGIAAYNGLLYLGVRTTTAINASLVLATIPVATTAVVVLVQGQRVGLAALAGVVLGLLGVLVTLARGDVGALLQLEAVPGDLLVLGAVAGVVAYTVLLRRLPPDLNPIGITLAVHVLALVLTAPFYLWELAAVGGFEVTRSVVLAVLYVGVMSTAVSFSMFNYAIGVVGANRAAQFVYLTPIFASLMAVVFLGERLAPYHAAGLALIFAGVYFATRRGAS